MAHTSQTPSRYSTGRPRGRPRKHPLAPDTEPPRKKLRYSVGGTSSRRQTSSVPQGRTRLGESSASGSRRPARRQTDGSRARRRSPDAHSQSGRDSAEPTPRYSSAAATASAITQNDSYKPREERGWEEFHADLDIDAPLSVLNAEDVDAKQYSANVTPSQLEALREALPEDSPILGQALQLLKGEASGPPIPLAFTPMRRRPGRPPKRPEAILYQLGQSPTLQKIVPAPIQNPKEKLVLPKPNFKRIETFASYEKSPGVGINFVDKSYANVGYQESEIFVQPRNMIRSGKDPIEEEVESALAIFDGGSTASNLDAATNHPRLRVEYDMDEQDERWLEVINAERKAQGVDTVRPQYFEVAMTLIEKEWHALEKRKLI